MRRRGRERTRKRFCKKIPAEPFSGALPGFSVIELLAIESIFQYNPIRLLCDFRRCFCSRIVLPISLPVLATIGLFLCFAYWNDWYQSMLYIDNTKLLSLQALLNQILTNIQMLVQNAATLGASAAEMLAKMPKEAARMSIVVIIVLPIACAYPFFQQYFISGLTVGAVKG